MKLIEEIDSVEKRHEEADPQMFSLVRTAEQEMVWRTSGTCSHNSKRTMIYYIYNILHINPIPYLFLHRQGNSQTKDSSCTGLPARNYLGKQRFLVKLHISNQHLRLGTSHFWFVDY